MKKYNEEYFSVREKRTHKKICDCGNFEDARMMMHLDAPNREIVKNKTLMSPVVDVQTTKALSTNEITINTKQYEEEELVIKKINQLPQIKLPERQEIPFNAK